MYREFKHTEDFKGIPAHWDKTALPELGFKVWSFLVSFLSISFVAYRFVTPQISFSCAFVDDCFLCNIMQRCW